MTSSPAGKALLEEIKRANSDNQAQLIQKIQNLQPMLFEECYVKSFDEIRKKQIAKPRAASEYDYRGVHLFVMVHGF